MNIENNLETENCEETVKTEYLEKEVLLGVALDT